MSTRATLWRYAKGLLAALAVGFGVVGVILLVEIWEVIPDTLSWLVLVVGIASMAYAAYRVSRPIDMDELTVEPGVEQ